jgi:hypothetical protein
LSNDNLTNDSSFNEITLPNNNDTCDEYEQIDSVVSTSQEDQNKNSNDEYIPKFNEYQRKQLEEQLRNVKTVLINPFINQNFFST